MNVILDRTWFSGPEGYIGIVAVDNGFEIKFYVGTGYGMNEQVDAEKIASNGAKLYAGPLIDFLQRNQLKRVATHERPNDQNPQESG
jgi:hypothetical protein